MSGREEADFRKRGQETLDRELGRFVFEKLPGGTSLDAYEQIWQIATGRHDDALACALLECFEAWFERNVVLPEGEAGVRSDVTRKEMGRRDTINWLEKIYLSLSISKQGERIPNKRNWEHDKYEIIYPLPKLKRRIISLIASRWKVRNRSEENVERFRYLIAAFVSWKGTRYEKYPSWMSQWERLAAKKRRDPLKAEQEMILEILRERADDTYALNTDDESIDPFYFWMCQEGVPKEFLEILAEKRTRNGKAELALRDGRYAEIIRPLGVEKRSPEGLHLAHWALVRVARLDRAREALHDRMQPWNGPLREWRQTGVGLFEERYQEIGGSEVVVGDIDFAMPSLNRFSVKVTLPQECSQGLAGDVFGRAKRHILSWKEEYSKYGVTLVVRLSDSDFQKSEVFT